jgi:hypothetical protein
MVAAFVADSRVQMDGPLLAELLVARANATAHAHLMGSDYASVHTMTESDYATVHVPLESDCSRTQWVQE